MSDEHHLLFRQKAIDAQALNAFQFEGKTGTLNLIRRLGHVQLDTLSVVARAHHHILWSRVENYQPAFLDALLRDKKIFEYWTHAAAYLPMEDYRFSLIRKNEFLIGKQHWFAKDKKMHRYVLDKIKAEGALQARDFETDKKRGSWFDWKPAKIALEQLFQNGALMVKERKGFQKVYDLTERVLPAKTNTTVPTKEEFARHLILSTIRAHGFASLKDITHLQSGMRTVVQKEIIRMLKSGELNSLKINNVAEDYFSINNVRTIENRRSAIENEACRILSPFDNLVIRRARLKKIFDYDFSIECYLPEHKRKFGYFCLPVLHKNEFVARFDPKADREKGIFYVKKFYQEKKMKKREKDGFMNAFEKELKKFATFNGCNKIVM